MIPQAPKKKKKNSSKVNLTISAVFHALLIGALVYFAARQGYLGKKLKEITVYKVEKEKPPEPPKKVEPPEGSTQAGNRTPERSGSPEAGGSATGGGAGGGPAIVAGE